jgi:hypothetical protein
MTVTLRVMVKNRHAQPD